MTTCEVVDRRHPGRDSAWIQAQPQVILSVDQRRDKVELTMRAAFAGSFAAQIAEAVRTRLTLPCEGTVGDEAGIISRLADIDVLVSMAFSARMADAAPRL